jgi:hypothetical protein
MIQPTNVAADPDPRGGSMALSWTNPILPGFAGTQILRSELDFPVVSSNVRNNQNVILDEPSSSTASAGGAQQFLDTNLKSETTYYYAIVAYDAAFRPYPAFISAMTTAPYQTAAYLYRNIPGVYQGYDTSLPPPSPGLDPSDAGKGQLLRLIEMFGPQFDMIRSFASGMKSFFSANEIDGTLLPLLAQWIGWSTNYRAAIAVQRNEVRFAPYYYATTGLTANLRASINRLVTWDAQVKEFAHNIFLSNRPEELSTHEQQRQGGLWQPATSVSLDVAYDGRASAVLGADGRLWLFLHVRQGGPGQTPDQWHLWYKICDRGEWLSARHLTGDAKVNKYPCAIQAASGSIWLFWSSADPDAPGRPMPRLRLQLLSAGRPALNARAQGANAGPFAFGDGDTFLIAIGSLQRTVTLRAEQFFSIAQATAVETAAVLDRELPGVNVTATADDKVQFVSQASSAAAQLAFPNSAVGSKLGVPVPGQIASGADAVGAQITGTRAEPFALADGDVLVITVDGDVPRPVTFKAAQTGAADIVAAINQVLPGVAAPAGAPGAGKIQLTSQNPGEASLICVDVDSSTAAVKLGFGASVPAAPVAADDTEPAAFEDAAGNVWVFWSSLRNRHWQIWYSRHDGSSWGPPKPLTAVTQPDREPFVLFDPANGGRIWVFWSRKKANGLWNVFFRTTAKLDFNTLTDADWTEFEMTPVPAPASYDNREPAAALSGPGTVDLYFASNRIDGWQIWNKSVTLTTQGVDTAITDGQFTRRAPVPLNAGTATLRLFFRANDSPVHTSAVYPASTTIDARFAGSTTADTRNPARLSLRGDFHDIGHYTYDTPKANPAEDANRWYSRDTVGVFLGPDTSDQQLIIRDRNLLATAINRFLPIQVRAVLLAGQVQTEYVYSYDQPGTPEPQIITDRVTDAIT